MTTGRSNRGPGGFDQSTGQSGFADQVIALVVRALWAHFIVVFIGLIGAWAVMTKSPLIAVPVVAVLVIVFVVTCPWHKRHASNVWLRGSLPTKFLSAGIANALGQPPRVRSVRHRDGVVVIVISSGSGHPADLFVRNKPALCAVLRAISVNITSDATTVTITAVRRSTHGD